MRISLCPQRRDDGLAVSKSGDVLTINGDTLDLSAVPEGATVENAGELHPLLTGTIERIGGEIHLTLVLPHGANPPPELAFPQPITATADGPIALPVAPEEAGEEE